MSENGKRRILLSRQQKNQKYLHTSLEMETSTHLPMLMKTIGLTTGPVVEIGSGMFSTPFLHWLLFGSGRKLTTVEHYWHYADFAKKFITPMHEVIEHDPKKAYQPEPGVHYGVVFIDHSPKKPRTRGDDAVLFKDCADFVVLHDAGPDGHKKYGYDNAYPHFKYRFDWNHVWPSTTVLSNFHDVTTWR
jgi:hypothetical protein